MNRITEVIALVSFYMFVGCSPRIQEIYVSPTGNSQNTGSQDSPVATIQEALDKAFVYKKANVHTQIHIHVSKGEYRLGTSIQLKTILSDVKIIGAGVHKVVVKGSQQLDLEWKKYKDQILVAKVHDKVQFDQFFVDGKQQILARYPNYDEKGGHWQGHAADAIDPERVKTWKQPKGGVVHAMHSGEWGGFHYEITKANEDGTLELTVGHQNNRPSKMHHKYRMVENIFEELDSPGEWYLDAKKQLLYYWPVENTSIKKAKLEGVILKNLLSIIGEYKTPVKNIEISGIKFEHAQRTLMEVYEPLLRSDWTMYRGGAIFIENSENISVVDCEFTNLGGNVIFVSKYNRGAVIKGNHIHDCGASAVSFVGDASAVRSPSFQYGEFVPLEEMDTVKGPANDLYPSDCIVDDNLMYRIGRVEKQVAGVQISMAMNITIRSNSIYDTPRAGINVSEGTWGGHIIEYNDVFNTVLETSDHGAFNSWGRDRFWHPNRSMLNKLTSDNPEMPYWDAIHTTEIKNNRFRCDHGWDIDLDDGSSNYIVSNNICLSGGIKLREGFYRTVENNIMVNNSFHPHVWFENSGDVFRKNVVMTDYKDIRLSGWGKEVDSNLFPNEKALKKAQDNGTDVNSVFGNPMFEDPKHGNYTLAENSPAFKIGFQNIPMDKFGVQKPSLKAIAKTPEFSVIWSVDDTNAKESITMNWLGAAIKNIETVEERSASGLNKTAGVVILKIAEETVLATSTLKVGDVIIAGEGEEINQIQDLLKVFQGHNWKGKINFKIFRNQKPMDLVVGVK
jgi:hypothetical protein